jgi:DNA-binding CsgD family transcriptional regulator
MKRADLISIVEESYATTTDDEAWLRGILAAAQPSLERGMGILGYLYDLSVLPGRILSYASLDSPFDAADVALGMTSLSNDYIDNSWRTVRVGTAASVPGFEKQPTADMLFRSRGVADLLVVNALDPSGIGVSVAVPDRRSVTLPPRQRAHYACVAAHLAAAFRLRRKVAELEAILAPSGGIVHAEGRAKAGEARTLLAAGARAMERARGKLRREDPDKAIRGWRALVGGRWSVLDHFESDGKRYLVARTNEPASRGPERLTERERQVLEYAALGLSNKEIAYELGIAAPTVRVLIARAALKLRATGREQLLARYKARTRT